MRLKIATGIATEMRLTTGDNSNKIEQSRFSVSDQQQKVGYPTGPLNIAEGTFPSASAAASSASSDTSQARTSSSAWSIAFSFMTLIHQFSSPLRRFQI